MSSLKRYLGVGEETTPGTPVAADVYLPIISESIAPTHGWVFPETVEARAAKRAKLGRFRNAGDVRMNVIPTGFTKFLKWALGKVTTTQPDAVGAPDTYLHTFEPADTLKTFTSRVGAELLEREIACCQVNTLEIASVIADVLLGTTIGIVGGEETKQTIGTPTFPSGDDAEEFAVAGATITLAGSNEAAIVEAMRVTLNNNIPDRWTHEARFEKRAAVGMRTVEGSLDLTFPDTDEYDHFLAGTEFALNYLAKGALIESTYYYQIEIDLPKCVYVEGAVPHVDRREELKLSAPFRAIIDPTAGYDLCVKVQNKETTI